VLSAILLESKPPTPDTARARDDATPALEAA